MMRPGWFDHGTGTAWRVIADRLFQRGSPGASATATLPDARLLTVGGPVFFISNEGAATLTVENSIASPVVAIPAGAVAMIALTSNVNPGGQWYGYVESTAPTLATATPVPNVALLSGGDPDGDQATTYSGFFDAFTARTLLPRDSALMSGAAHAGKGYQFGNHSGNQNATDEYDPAGDTWTAKTNRPTSTIRHTASHSDTGVHVFGGDAVAAAQRFDGTTWTTLSSVISARRDVTSARTFQTGTQKLWVIGGGDANPWGQNMLEYSVGGDTYTARSILPYMPRGQASATGIGSKVVVAGGQSVGASAALDCPVFDSDLNVWSAAVGFPGPERWGMACTTVDSRACVFGGNVPVATLSSECWELGLTANSWSRLTDFSGGQDSWSNQGMGLS